MRWIRTTIGEKAHAVFSGRDHTLCGIAVAHARAIVTPGVEDRCENCDHLWRKAGRDLIRKVKKRADRRKRPFVYTPRFNFHDWEER